MKFIIMIVFTVFSLFAEEKIDSNTDGVNKKENTKINDTSQEKSKFINGPFRDGYFFEPYGGIVLGSFDQNYDANGTYSSGSSSVTLNSNNAFTGGDLYGISLGSRVAAKKWGFFAGFDGRLDVTQYDQWLYNSNSFSTESYDVVEVMLGLVGGYESEAGFKIYGGFLPMSSLVVEGKDGQSNTYKGQGYKLGLGWTFSNSFGFNIEYSEREFDERDNRKLPTTYTIGNINVNEKNLEVSDILLSMSFTLGKAE